MLVRRSFSEGGLSLGEAARGRIPYTEASIRNMVSSGELVEGRHYFKRRRRIMFSWQAMREWVEQQSIAETAPLPLARNRRNGHPE